MVGGCTGCLAATRSVTGPADRSALLVTADMSVQAVIVNSALYLDTGHVRVAFIALLAGADWVVVDHPAERVVPTGAGVFADLVDAGVRLSTLVVRLAAREDGAEGLAALVVTGHVAVRAGADHGADREGVNHRAGGGGDTGAQLGAERLAATVQAGLLAGTVLVLHTLRGGQGDTANPGVPGVADRAETAGLVVVNLAESTGSAGVLVQAGVDAVLAPAGLVQRALGVAATADDLAGRERISFVSRQTPAVGPVAGGITLCEPATGISARQEAGVDTLSLHTGLPVPTVVVALAAGQLTPDLRVADVSGRAGADRVMVLDEALRSSPTVAGVLALSVHAGGVSRTVVVPSTAGRVGQLHRFAAGVGVRDPALSAGTDHRPEGQTVDHRADRGEVAGREGVAGVGTSLLQTGRVVRAVSVSPTLRLRLRDVRLEFWCAGDERVAHPARGTGALGVVVAHTAGSRGRTGVLVQAGVEALVANTGRALGAVLVDPALHPHTVGVGVALQSWGTAAGGLVVGGVTLSIGSTGVVSDTGIKTVAVSTNLCDRTLRI